MAPSPGSRRNEQVPRTGRRVIAALLALSIAQTFAVLVPAWAVKSLFDQVLSGAPAAPAAAGMAGPLTAFVLATVAVIAIEVTKRRVAVELAIRHAAELRTALFKARLEGRAPTSSKGNLLLPFVGDLTAARRWLSEGLPRAVSAMVLLPAVILMIAWNSPPMALTMAAALAASLAVSALLLPPLERTVRDVRSHRGALTSYLTGRLLAADVVRSSGRVAFEVGKASRRTGHLASAERRRAWAVGATRGSARLTTGLLLLAALYSGVWKWPAATLRQAP